MFDQDEPPRALGVGGAPGITAGQRGTVAPASEMAPNDPKPVAFSGLCCPLGKSDRWNQPQTAEPKCPASQAALTSWVILSGHLLWGKPAVMP